MWTREPPGWKRGWRDSRRRATAYDAPGGTREGATTRLRIHRRQWAGVRARRRHRGWPGAATEEEALEAISKRVRAHSFVGRGGTALGWQQADHRHWSLRLPPDHGRGRRGGRASGCGPGRPPDSGRLPTDREPRRA